MPCDDGRGYDCVSAKSRSQLMRAFSTFLLFVLIIGVADVRATTYHVAQSPKAADSNSGTEAAPWKTISRAAAAKELKPGDTVVI